MNSPPSSRLLPSSSTSLISTALKYSYWIQSERETVYYGTTARYPFFHFLFFLMSPTQCVLTCWVVISVNGITKPPESWVRLYIVYSGHLMSWIITCSGWKTDSAALFVSQPSSVNPAWLLYVHHNPKKYYAIFNMYVFYSNICIWDFFVNHCKWVKWNVLLSELQPSHRVYFWKLLPLTLPFLLT